MSIRKSHRAFALVSAALVGAVALAGCSAGSRTPGTTATEVECNFDDPASPTTVNVLAYNSSAIDPFTNTMVSSCTHGNVTVKHDPIDFGGQVTRTTATLAGDTGTYDIIETYGFVIPGFADDGKIMPLDDLWDAYADEYDLGEISEAMRAGMSYDGQLYGLPMQAQMFVMAYRADIFENLGLEVPTTLAEMGAAAEAIRAAGEMQYPIALPLLSTNDVGYIFEGMLNSLGSDYVNEAGEVTLDTPEARTALQELVALTEYMDPEFGTFDQPRVQQQMFNGTAAMTFMFSGRMNDLTQESNTDLHDSFAFAAPPRTVDGAEYLVNRLSIDGWSIPFNTQLDHDLLFHMMASAVSEDASRASVPAAYPAREGMVSEDSSPYAKAANDSMAAVMPPVVSPILADVTNEIVPILAQVVNGSISIDDGLAQMQAAGERVAG